jgi:hypothetical protein
MYEDLSHKLLAYTVDPMADDLVASTAASMIIYGVVLCICSLRVCG